MRAILAAIFCSGLICSCLCGQTVIKGLIHDLETNEGLIGAAVQIEGTTIGTSSDYDGNFILETDIPLPLTIKVSYISYNSKTIEVTAANAVSLKIALTTNSVVMDAVQVKAQRISEKEQQAALTVESMDVLAIKEAASGSFYESLGTLKGVDVNSASLGFKVINTRGFNSTSPVRSLQLIDGVDNQSPGLNFSLGNFLGAPDLDVKSVEIVAGASSAFYGPGAFNGVINMETRSPWLFPGISVEYKTGSRDLRQYGIRYAKVYKNKEDRDFFAFKLNALYLTADDWNADNLDPSTSSEAGADNYAGYDAVNRYGDEVLSGGNYYPGSAANGIGPGRVYRRGYLESDLVDYDTDNLKTGLGLYLKPTRKTELNYAFNYSTGTTVYQGDNRFSLRNIQFFQNKLEFKKDSVFFIRAYSTKENAGDSYDAVLTAFLMQERSKKESTYYTDYNAYWANVVLDQLLDAGMPDNAENQPSIIEVLDECDCPFAEAQEIFAPLFLTWQSETLEIQQSWVANNPEIVAPLHEETETLVNTIPSPGSQEQPYYQPGTQRYDSLFKEITSTLITDGGSAFYDRSALYHIHGQYEFDLFSSHLTVGSNYRIYRPDTRGTLMSDTAGIKIKNWEYGAYIGARQTLMDDRLILNETVRMDMSQNFDEVISPAISAVYSTKRKHVYRLSYSTALRNPTLGDQYLYLDVGRAILLGNIDGRDSLVTTDSFQDAFTSSLIAPNKLEFFDVAPLKPEKVQTIEGGFRGLFGEKIYADISGYKSWYTDFIGYNIGLDVEYTPGQNLPPTAVQVFRIAANANDIVTTQGVNVGLNYYLWNNYSLSGNYSYNELDLKGSEDPIIPAFNTPKNKYNIGFNGRNLVSKFGGEYIRNWGFSFNYKWVQGFTFEGSPQFTGEINAYGLLDAQVNKTYADRKLNFKIGASNLLNNQVFQVYGGPRIGRMAYLSITYSPDNR